ncbi:hypothetical protein [Chryseobacterium soli]|nr:hypothetical protein [Chryseobacterium soli]
MMRTFFLFLLLSFKSFYAQEISQEAYEIYGLELANLEYKSYQFRLGIPEKYQETFIMENDSIGKKIRNLSAKKIFDSDKLSSMIVKQTPQNIKFKRIIFDRTEVMYCSPIYFKNNNNEAYFFFVIDSKSRLKPVCIYLYAYRKSDGKWCTEDYYYIF